MSEEKKNTAVAKNEQADSERFINLCMREITGIVPQSQQEGDILNFRRRMLGNYKIALDLKFKELEAQRISKNAMIKDESKKELLEYAWKNVEMENLIKNVYNYSFIGLDPLVPNHVNMYPVKTKAGKWGIVFIKGYVGLEIIARKYGMDTPDDIIVDIVYKNDSFVPIKKDVSNNVESYKFEISNPFDRGEIVGGFYYFQYFRQPDKNKLKVMSIKDIMKRKPKYASTDFWGGDKDVWENGKKTDKKEHIEGWLDEMVMKTLKRAAWNSIPIDSSKMDVYIKGVINEDKLQQVDPVIEENAQQTAAGKTLDITEIQEVKEEKPKSELF